MSKFLISKYQNIEKYVPGEQPQNMESFIKLNTNESPYPPSPGVMKAISENEIFNLRLYSDPESTFLKQKLAALYDVNPDNLFLSNGSDDILNFIFMIFCGSEKEIMFPEISYGFYKVYAQLHEVRSLQVPLKKDFGINFIDYCNAGRNIIIANPNPPSGQTLSFEKIETIVSTNPDNLVVIDEAYVDFGTESVVPLIKKYPNLLVVQTFSKSRSMAGARLGFAVGDVQLIEDLHTIQYSTNPYNINRLTQSAACAAIDENDYYVDRCKEIAKTREFTIEELRKIGFYVVPSKANFIFIRHDRIDGEELYLKLKERKILIRHFSDENIRQFNRVTIGTRAQMNSFIQQVKDILEESEGNNNA